MPGYDLFRAERKRGGCVEFRHCLFDLGIVENTAMSFISQQTGSPILIVTIDHF